MKPRSRNLKKNMTTKGEGEPANKESEKFKNKKERK